MSEIDFFDLNCEQIKILYSFLYFLIKEDIDMETDLQKIQLKRKWLANWINSININLQTYMNNHNQINSDYLTTDSYQLYKEVEKMKQNLNKKIPLYLIILELSLFTIYHPLGIKEDDEFKKLSLAKKYRQTIINKLEFFANQLGVEKEYVTLFKTNYKQWKNKILGSNPINFVLGGLIGGAIVTAAAATIAIPVFVPFLVPLLAPGLEGFAAISAVLAALGVGAVTASGLGMTGRMVVIIGGDAILGTSFESGISSLLAQCPSLIVPQAAKFLVIFNDILLNPKNMIKQEIVMEAQHIIKQQQNHIHNLEKKISELQMSGNKQEEQINNLQKLVKYLRKTLNISQNLLKHFLQKHSLS